MFYLFRRRAIFACHGPADVGAFLAREASRKGVDLRWALRTGLPGKPIAAQPAVSTPSPVNTSSPAAAAFSPRNGTAKSRKTGKTSFTCPPLDDDKSSTTTTTTTGDKDDSANNSAINASASASGAAGSARVDSNTSASASDTACASATTSSATVDNDASANTGLNANENTEVNSCSNSNSSAPAPAPARVSANDASKAVHKGKSTHVSAAKAAAHIKGVPATGKGAPASASTPPPKLFSSGNGLPGSRRAAVTSVAKKLTNLASQYPPETVLMPYIDIRYSFALMARALRAQKKLATGAYSYTVNNMLAMLGFSFIGRQHEYVLKT